MTSVLSQESVSARLAGAVGWEAKNRLLVQLSRELPTFDEQYRTEQYRVAGCESQVWLHLDWQENRLSLNCGSDSRVVQGLLALVFACYQGLSAADILRQDFESWIAELGLNRFLSASRGNGLKAIVAKITEAAQSRIA